MKSYLQFLSRNKLYTAIEAVGLIVSLAFVILIATSVRDHWRLIHDRPGQENLYLVGPPTVPYLGYSDMKRLESIPEVKRSAGLNATTAMAVLEGEKRQCTVTFADPEILEIMGLKLVSGSADQFLSGMGVLISEPAVRKFFPDSDPLGQMVTLEERTGQNMDGEEGESAVPLPIVGVTEDPGSTLLSDFDFLASFYTPIPLARYYVGESDGMKLMMMPLVELVPNADRDAFRAKYQEVASYLNDPMLGADLQGEILTPLREVYQMNAELTGLRQGKTLYLIVLVILGLILLLSAVLNYVNLNLAASGARAKEMATRRLVGDDRGGIIRRSVGESLLFTSVCFVLATLLAVAIVPGLNSLRPPGLAISFRVCFDGFFVLLAVLTLLGVGGLAGLIPAGFLASWRPLDVVSGRVRRKRKMGFSRVCIVLQTALALLLVVMSLTVQAQLRHLQKMDIGISPEPELFYFYPSLSVPLEGLADRLRTSPQVQEVGFAAAIPTHPNMMGFGSDFTYMSYSFDCDTTAFRLLGYRIKEEYEPMRPGLYYLTEEAQHFLGVSRDDPGKYEKPIGGIIETFRTLPVNGIDRVQMMQPGMTTFCEIGIGPVGWNWYDNGIVVRTTGSRKEFKEFFRATAQSWFLEQVGFADVFSGEEGVCCGYLDEIIARDYEDLAHYSSLVGIFALIAILLAMLGLLAMSTYYSGIHTKSIAIRKVFGGTVDSEAWRSIRNYMLWVTLAVVIAVPVGIVLVRRFLEDYPERIGNCWWIYVVSVLLTLLISFLSVLWQTLRAAHTNPAVELKKE